jgi:hypothetical protein
MLNLDSSGRYLAGYRYASNKGVVLEIATGNWVTSIACENGNPIYIPGKTQILCSNLQPSQSVYVVNADGSGRKNIATSNYPIASAVSPDGKYSAVTQAANGLPKFSLVALSGDFPKWDWNAFDGFSINNAALATNKTEVTLEFRPPIGTSEILVSNDGGFSDAQDFSADTQSVSWSLAADGPTVSTRVVYVRFDNGQIWTDSIILDYTAPVINSVQVLSNKVAGTERVVSMKPTITERGSGVVLLQYSDQGTKTGLKSKKLSIKASQKKIAQNVSLTFSKSKSTYYLRFKDAAGNWSKWKAVKR